MRPAPSFPSPDLEAIARALRAPEQDLLTALARKTSKRSIYDIGAASSSSLPMPPASFNVRPAPSAFATFSARSRRGRQAAIKAGSNE